jgi:hypothetical protein
MKGNEEVECVWCVMRELNVHTDFSCVIAKRITVWSIKGRCEDLLQLGLEKENVDGWDGLT